MPRRFAIAFIFAALALTACSKAEEATDNADYADVGPADAPWGQPTDTSGRIPGEIARDDVPRPRQGLWLVTVQRDGQGELHDQVCERGEPLDIVPDGACPNVIVRRAGAGFRVDWRCQTGAGMATMATRYDGDFVTGYTARNETRVTPEGGQPQITHGRVTAKYLGACT